LSDDKKKDKKRKPWWEDESSTDDFDYLEKFMDDFAKNIMNLPNLSEMIENMLKELNLSGEPLSSKRQPLFWGVSITQGPDNKPIIRKFGNIEPEKEGAKIKEEIEPLVDVIDGEESLVVVAELPGIEKKDIKLNATSDSLVISVDTPEKKYYKKLSFESKVDPKSSKAVYKNGVLEITFNKQKSKTKNNSISIQ